MKTYPISLLLFASFITFSCQKSEVLPKDEVAGNEPATTSPTVNKSLILQLVNEVRTKGCQCGNTYYQPATPVSWNNQLEAAAYVHSADMNQNNFFSHTAPNGTNAGVRITNAGYNWRTYGENIASGYKTEASVVKGWVESEGHCKNIMNPAFKEMGVARAGNYWTQEFGAR
jgi:uncharacterized protein YkwD